ncbi:hypothetical protein CAEBREN_09024 [Caenorhabditis brenneri]|uniref:Uncharacterized protein n=1 Tax=Caenorhabditis brenneri TaxID=135651 RepID=G0P3A8_CAEBE|nr:hypothetical protein CAEBREN_09024 [Caenorhabditis brenneri]
MSSAFHWSNDFGLTAQNEIQGRSSREILRTKIQKVIESSHEALVDGASFNIPASKDSIQLVDFLRVYRTWLLMTDYNNIREIDDTMGQEIRDYDQREDGAPVKRNLYSAHWFTMNNLLECKCEHVRVFFFL